VRIHAVPKESCVCEDMGARSCSHATLHAKLHCKEVLQRCFTLTVFGIHTLTIPPALTIHASEVANLQGIIAHANHTSNLCVLYDQQAWPKQVMPGIRTTADSEKKQCYLCPPTGTCIVLHLQLSSSVTLAAWLVHCKGLPTSGVNDSDAVLEHCGMLGERPPEVLLRC